VAVAGLRVRLDAAYARAHWALNAPGAPGRALVQDTGGPVTIGLRLGGPVTLTAHARLVPHDWREGSGALRAFIETTDAHGHHHRLWTGTLASAERNGNPDGLPITVALAPDTTELRFDLEQINVRDGRAVGRLMWIEPTLTDPHAPATPTPPAPDPLAPVTAPEHGPLISVLTPVHDPPPHMLEEAIASVRAQTYPHWELCLLDDGSRNPEIIHALHRHAASDPRIHLHRHDTAQGISAATNAALAHATGDYIALLDHDDTLTPDALAHVAHHINHNPHLDMLYSDEAVVNADVVASNVKPDWSPENLCGLMYTCHLGVYRRTLLEDIGAFDSEFDGCQDYDVALRVSERTDQIAHIPHILYHWRAHGQSAAGGEEAKPYAYVAQPRAITDHLRRTGDATSTVQFGAAPGLHRIVHRPDPGLTVDIATCASTPAGVAEAASSWVRQSHPNWRLVLATHDALADELAGILRAAGLPDDRFVIVAGAPGDDALRRSLAAAEADYVVAMQAPAAGLTRDWLERLLGYARQPGIAAAGPVVLSSTGRIADAGIALPDGVPLPLLHGLAAGAASPVVLNVSAVSGVMAIARTTLHDLGGLHPEFGDLALVELCLRARATGARIVTVPDARLRATTPDTTTNDLPNLWRIRQTWRAHHTHDPYYNPNFRRDRGDFVLREPSA
jgi:GT2 family glycosyltransferase